MSVDIARILSISRTDDVDENLDKCNPAACISLLIAVLNWSSNGWRRSVDTLCSHICSSMRMFFASPLYKSNDSWNGLTRQCTQECLLSPSDPLGQSQQHASNSFKENAICVLLSWKHVHYRQCQYTDCLHGCQYEITHSKNMALMGPQHARQHAQHS